MAHMQNRISSKKNKHVHLIGDFHYDITDSSSSFSFFLFSCLYMTDLFYRVLSTVDKTLHATIR